MFFLVLFGFGVFYVGGLGFLFGGFLVGFWFGWGLVCWGLFICLFLYPIHQTCQFCGSNHVLLGDLTPETAN